jgi:hypothetical protein
LGTINTQQKDTKMNANTNGVPLPDKSLRLSKLSETLFQMVMIQDLTDGASGFEEAVAAQEEMMTIPAQHIMDHALKACALAWRLGAWKIDQDTDAPMIVDVEELANFTVDTGPWIAGLLQDAMRLGKNALRPV